MLIPRRAKVLAYVNNRHAGLVGVEPGRLTLRELLAMAEARAKDEWARASSLMALKSTHNHRHRPAKPVKVPDRLAHRHVHVETLEELTQREIEQFITVRIAQDGIAPKTANRQRGVLHGGGRPRL